MRYIAIVAVDDELGIGRAGTLAWQNSEDLGHFKRTTSGHPIIMGANTYRSIGRPLPNRRNIVLSRSHIDAPGCEIFSDVESLFEVLGTPNDTDETVFVIGGAQIYASFLTAGYLDEIWVSHISGMHNCDVFFPEFRDAWSSYETEIFESFELKKYRPKN